MRQGQLPFGNVPRRRGKNLPAATASPKPLSPGTHAPTKVRMDAFGDVSRQAPAKPSHNGRPMVFATLQNRRPAPRTTSSAAEVEPLPIYPIPLRQSYAPPHRRLFPKAASIVPSRHHKYTKDECQLNSILTGLEGLFRISRYSR